MRFSVFTPSHNLKYIERPLNSLSEQTFTDFEWVLLLNGEALNEKESIEKKIKKRKIKYKLIEAPDSENKNIGYLKLQCCNNSSGEILVELDHDDELEKDCLEKLNLKFEESGANFVFSDDYAIRTSEDGVQKYETPFDKKWGWIVKEQEEGKPYHPTFYPTPLSLSYIYYAPDHVRAWDADFYRLIGGHNPDLEVCDDYDLMCRTYIYGTMDQISEPLYKYHYHEDNTAYGEKNKKIQELTHELHDKYMEAIVSRWCDTNNLKKVDLCSCDNKPDGFIGVDKRKLNDDDIVFDLDKPNWPFEDNSVGVFRAWDALEHLKDPVNTMKEIHRCLAPYGWALIEVPSTDGRGAFQDPTHVSFWNSNSFWYYTKHSQAKFIDSPVRFQLNRVANHYPTDWHRFHNILYTTAHLVKLNPDGHVPPHGREM